MLREAPGYSRPLSRLEYGQPAKSVIGVIFVNIVNSAINVISVIIIIIGMGVIDVIIVTSIIIVCSVIIVLLVSVEKECHYIHEFHLLSLVSLSLALILSIV